MRKASLITLGILVVLFFIGLYYYYKLGGFQKPVIKLVETPAYVIAGKDYKGELQSRNLGKLFNEADRLIEGKKLNGTTVGVYYTHPDSNKVDAFIGVILKDTNQTLPEGYSKRYIPKRKVLQAYIKDVMVAPQIYPDINKFADSAKLQLVYKEYLEIYQLNKESYTEVPVK